MLFFVHRKADNTQELKLKIRKEVERLVIDKGVDTFLFGSKSNFDSLCLDVVTDIKEKYPHIKRVYVRAEYPYISDEYKDYLLSLYDETYYPEKALVAGRAVYVERNYEMIAKSDYCLVYYRQSQAPTTRKSGTKVALDYATKLKKEIIPV